MKTTSQKSTIRSNLPALLLLGLALVSCYQWWCASAELAGAQEATVDFTGTVTLDSLPLATGVFQLTRADGQTIGVPITDGQFRITAVPVGDWLQCISGPGVPKLYHDLGTITIDANMHSTQFGLKGTEQLKLHALSLLEKSASE